MSALLSVSKPDIRILLYTDDPRIAETNDFGQFLGLGSMIERLNAHAPIFANLSHKWVNRNPVGGLHAQNKIHNVLASETFDEIWFFGFHQTNLKSFSLQTFLGGPESELDEDEVEALKTWMNIDGEGSRGGGVLMTGDHASKRPPILNPPSIEECSGDSVESDFLGLGRAIGRCVPRAGLLRTWEGPPTNRTLDSFNTLVVPGFETDLRPQQLELIPVDSAGDPDPSGQPHPLFFYRPKRFIKVLPDHAHEGQVILPKQFPPTVWPSGSYGQTLPRVVARGTNTTTKEPINIIATYNGDLSGVGRIVADSSWHHYFNLNLRNLPHPAPVDSFADQIGQFYANLAVWLAPRKKRIQMAQAMTWQLADYTWLLEERDSPTLGETADSILGRVASRCEINEMVQALISDWINETQLTDLKQIIHHQPSRQRVLFHIIESYHKAARTEGELQPTAVQKIITRGLTRAFE